MSSSSLARVHTTLTRALRWAQRVAIKPKPITCRLDLARLGCQVMNAVIRIETSSPGSSTPSLAT